MLQLEVQLGRALGHGRKGQQCHGNGDSNTHTAKLSPVLAGHGLETGHFR
jgi:hypothetical protein